MIRVCIGVFAVVACGYAFAADTQDPPSTVSADTKSEFVAAYRKYEALMAEDKSEEALPHAEVAYRLGTEIYGRNHKNTAALALNYGQLLIKQNQVKAAIPVLDDAIEQYRQIYGKDAKELVDPLMSRGNATGAWAPKQQLVYYDAALDIARATLNPDDLLLAQLNLEAGIHLLRDGNVEQSKAFFDAAYEQYKKQVAASDARFVVTSFWLGKYYLTSEKPRIAEPYFNQVLAAFEGAGAPENTLATATHALLVMTYQQLGEPARATPHYVAVGKMQPWSDSALQTPLYRLPPSYPPDAKGREGMAVLEFTIDADGYVREPKLLRTDGSDSFGEPALAAISGWRYAPRFVDGNPVATPGMQAEVRFKLVP
ncbi:MAG TPA: TonB family protein [Pseudomonadales bacterium]